MKDKIDFLLKRVTKFQTQTKNSLDSEAFALVRRSLESIKLEISHGTPIDPATIDSIETRLLRLENIFKNQNKML